MKHPRDYTLGEIESILRVYPSMHAQSYINGLCIYVAKAQQEARDFQVAKEVEQIKTRQPATRRQARSVEQDVYEHCVLVAE